MATTAKGTPYVESSDLVANYPAVSLALAEHIDDFGGKVLQVVRATDTTLRSTTSETLVDATGMSVTITPQKSDSKIVLIFSYSLRIYGKQNDYQYSLFRIADSSNNAISGAENHTYYTRYIVTGSSSTSPDFAMPMTLVAYDTPGSTAAKTYKLRFASGLPGGTIAVFLRNTDVTAQMFAIEVSA